MTETSSQGRSLLADWTLVFFVAVPLAFLLSIFVPAPAANEALTLVVGVSGVGRLAPYAALIQPLIVIMTVLLFYRIGKVVEFGRHPRELVAASFLGGLIGGLPSFYGSVSSLNGHGWDTGFGYVSSMGLAEPASVIDLLTVALLFFLIPVAGLGLRSLEGKVPSDGEREASFSKSFLAASFVVVVAALPAAELVSRVISPRPYFAIGVPSLWVALGPGLVGFAVFPALFILEFYLLGDRVRSGSLLRDIVVPVFVGGALGLVVGVLLTAYLSSPIALRGYLAFSPFAKTILLSLSQSVLIGAICLGAVSFRKALIAPGTGPKPRQDARQTESASPVSQGSQP
jgi:hypothetical protein